MDDSYEIALQETAEIGYDLEDDTDDEEEEQMAVEISTQSARVDGATSCHTNILSHCSHSPLRSYISSSSARQKQIKKTDCKFCDVNIPPSCLIDHLKKETS